MGAILLRGGAGGKRRKVGWLRQFSAGVVPKCRGDLVREALIWERLPAPAGGGIGFVLPKPAACRCGNRVCSAKIQRGHWRSGVAEARQVSYEIEIAAFTWQSALFCQKVPSHQ